MTKTPAVLIPDPPPMADPAKLFRDVLRELLAAAPEDITAVPGLTQDALERYQRARHLAEGVLGT